MGETLLVRYGELALKSPPVRRQFETQLKRNILEAFQRAGLSCTLSADRGHLYVEVASATAAVPLLRRIFGVVSVSPVEVVPTDVEGIAKEAVRLSRESLRAKGSFAVRARRNGTHPFTSQELAARVGEAVLAANPDRDIRVDLGHPEVEIQVEVRDNRTYLSLGRYSAPGGLPLGVAGRIGALVDGPRGALGAYLMMKRGCRVLPVTAGLGDPLARETLQRFDPRLVLEGPLDPGSTWERLREKAQTEHLDGVSLPLQVEQFAPAREFFGEVVVFSPTVGIPEEEVLSRWSSVEELAR